MIASRGPSSTNPVEAEDVVLAVAELVSDELLRLALVRRDQVRSGAHRQVHGLAVRVDHGRHTLPLELADQVRVDVVGDAARVAAGEDADVRPLGEVDQLLAEERHLRVAHLRARLVHLGLDSGRGIDHGRRGARLLLDAHEVAQDRLLGELLDDARAGGPARETCRDHRLPERLQRAREVDALAAGHRALLRRAMASADLEVGNGERLVDRRVQGDGDDHVCRQAPSPYTSTLQG